MILLYPSLSQTFYQAFKLYTQTFMDVFWFLLLLALSHLALDKFFPAQSNIDLMFFSRIFLDMCLSTLFFSFILTALYQKQTTKQCDIFDVIAKGSHSFIDLLIAYLLISTPLLFTLVLQALLTSFYLSPLLQQLSLVLALIATIIIVIFCLLAPMFILTQQQTALESIKKSVALVKPYWVDTLLVVFMYGIIAISLSFLLQDLTVSYHSAIFTVLTSSFYPALILMHFETLKKCEARIKLTQHVG